MDPWGVSNSVSVILALWQVPSWMLGPEGNGFIEGPQGKGVQDLKCVSKQVLYKEKEKEQHFLQVLMSSFKPRTGHSEVHCKTLYPGLEHNRGIPHQTQMIPPSCFSEGIGNIDHDSYLYLKGKKRNETQAAMWTVPTVTHGRRNWLELNILHLRDTNQIQPDRFSS